MEQHKKNISIYLANGGNPKTAKRLELPTLENRARVSFLISQFAKVIPVEPELVKMNQEKQENIAPEVKPSKPALLGLISQYPVELHGTYQEAYQLWTSVCSLKIQLNTVPEKEEKTAFEIQTSILDKMERFDKYKVALHFYNEHKRLLPTESESDFSNLSPVELLNKRNNLRGLITRRKQTISKMESELPTPDALDYFKKIASVNSKKEQLQKLILDEEKLNKMIK